MPIEAPGEIEQLNREGFAAFAARAGAPAAALLGDSSWDLVALVEYPSRQAFLEMVSSAEYQAIGHLRTEALVRSELHPMDPAPAP